MTTKELYAKQRLDPKWQKFRLEIMNRDGFGCLDCESKDKTLNVHHSYYVKGRKPWEYPRFSVSTLCWECHENRHEDFENGEMLEWEKELDWLLQGNPNNQGAFWFLAATVSQIVKTAPSAAIAYDVINKILIEHFSEK